jgi:hypothetical protein
MRMTESAGAIRVERLHYGGSGGITQDSFAGYVLPGVFPWHETISTWTYRHSTNVLARRKTRQPPSPLSAVDRDIALHAVGRLVASARRRLTAPGAKWQNISHCLAAGGRIGTARACAGSREHVRDVRTRRQLDGRKRLWRSVSPMTWLRNCWLARLRWRNYSVIDSHPQHSWACWNS